MAKIHHREMKKTHSHKCMHRTRVLSPAASNITPSLRSAVYEVSQQEGKQRTMPSPPEESIVHSCMRVDEQPLKNHLNPSSSSSSSLQTSQTPPRASKKKRKEAAAALTIPHST